LVDGADPPGVAVKINLHAGHLTFLPISSSGISNARLQAGHLMLVGMTHSAGGAGAAHGVSGLGRTAYYARGSFSRKLGLQEQSMPGLAEEK
jgi:hypothetical protein